MTFGERIRRIRHEHGMTLRKLAAALGVSVPYLHDVEVGRRAPFSDDVFAQFMAVLLVDDATQRELRVGRVVARGWLDVQGLDARAVGVLIDACEVLRRRS